MFTETINGVQLSFETAGAAFSPLGCDKGTFAMISAAQFSQNDNFDKFNKFDNSKKILDLGCGYGIVGIYAAKIIGEENVVMSDIDKKCIELSKRNAEINGVSGIKVVQSDGFKNIQDTDFTLILSNPPYHSDFSVPKHFIEKGFNRLKIGGMMYMVTKRKEWYKNKFISIFGGVKLTEIDGYFVFCAEKRSTKYANR